MFWKDGLSKKNRAGIWFFLYYQERWYFFFPKISCYSLDGKWKMIFLKKIHGNMIFSSNVLKRWSFQKNRTGTWSFLLYYLERWYFFFPKIWSYSLDGKWKMIFLKKIHGNMTFFSNGPKRWFFQNKSRWNMIFLVLSGKMGVFFRKDGSFSLDRKWKMIFLKIIFTRKNTLKGDWHSRSHSINSSNDSLYFYGDLLRCFHILLSSEKKQKMLGNLICRIEIWLLLQFIWLEIFYNEESSTFCTIQSSGVVFKGVLERYLSIRRWDINRKI